MSEDNDKQSIMNMFKAAVGFILFLLLSVLITTYPEFKENFYLNNPDVIPGTVIFIALFVGVPLMGAAGFLLLEGAVPLVRNALDSALPESEELSI